MVYLCILELKWQHQTRLLGASELNKKWKKKRRKKEEQQIEMNETNKPKKKMLHDSPAESKSKQLKWFVWRWVVSIHTIQILCILWKSNGKRLERLFMEIPQWNFWTKSVFHSFCFCFYCFVITTIKKNSPILLLIRIDLTDIWTIPRDASFIPIAFAYFLHLSPFFAYLQI